MARGAPAGWYPDLVQPEPPCVLECDPYAQLRDRSASRKRLDSTDRKVKVRTKSPEKAASPSMIGRSTTWPVGTDPSPHSK